MGDSANLPQPTGLVRQAPSDLSRRAAIGTVAACIGLVADSAFGASPNASSTSASKEEPSSKMMTIRSPKDGVVSSVVATQGQSVTGNHSVICEIEPDDEAQALSRVVLSQRLIALEAEYLSDSQVQARRRLVEIAVEITKKYQEYAEFKYSNDQTQFDLGLITDVVLKQADAAVTKSKGEYEKAKLALTTFDTNLASAKARNELLSAQIPSEIAFIKHKMKRLQILATDTGRVTLHVGVGSFVKAGDTIAEIVK